MAASDNEGLEVSIEISHQRMLQRVAQIEARLLKLADRADDAFKKTNNSAVKGFERTARASKQMTGNLRGMSQQLSQVVQQAQAGTNVFSALAMQLPDMVVGLGPVAILLGAVAGGLATIATNAIMATDETDQFEDAMEQLEGILKGLENALKNSRMTIDELIDTYGNAAISIRTLIGAQAELRVSMAQTKLSESLPNLKKSSQEFQELGARIQGVASKVGEWDKERIDWRLKIISEEAGRLGKELGLSSEQVKGLSLAFADLSKATSAEEQRDALVALVETAEELEVPLSALPDEIEKGLDDMIALATATAQADKVMQDLAETASAVADQTGRMGSTSGLPLYMWGLSGDNLLPPSGNPPKKTRRGTRKKITTPEEFATSATKPAEDMEREIKLIGETQAKIAELTTKWMLLDEAKRKGVDLNAKVASTGKTVSETIDEQAAKVGKLTKEFEQANSEQEFYTDMQNTLNDGIIDSIVNAKDFGDVLDDLAKKLAAAALEAALFGSGPLGGMGIFGGGLFPTAAGGNTARAGQAMLINENTPHSEVFVPSGNGGVLNVNQAQAALKQAAKGSGGGTASVELVVRQEPGVVVEIARQQAATVVTEYDATLPSRVNKINGDPRAI